ncbi:MAG TPA: hypothetical protein VIM38_10215 [Alphaproteobacteria bacterium]|jgi:hypothetical protein
MADEPDDGDRTRANIAAIVVVIVLLIGGYFLVQAVVDNARLQECLARRQINCAPVEVPPE